MSSWYVHHSLLTAILLVAVFAAYKGGPAERLGACLNVLDALAVQTLQVASSGASLELGLLVVDGLMGIGLIVLAVRYTSLWIGAALLLQAAQFTLHGFYYVTHKPMDWLFAIVNNSVSWGLLLCIIAGTLGTWLVSRRAQNSR